MGGEVFCRRSGPFRFTIDPRIGLTALQIEVPGLAPVVAVLDVDELAAIEAIFAHVVQDLERGGVVRVDLPTALRDAIGRDPFEGQ